MKRLSLLVKFILMASEAAIAANTWETMVPARWPSEEHQRGFGVQTSFWAVVHTDVGTNADHSVWTNRYWTNIEAVSNATVVGHVQTNAWLDLKELRALDSYRARVERGAFTDRFLYVLGVPKFYRNDRDNLLDTKMWFTTLGGLIAPGQLFADPTSNIVGAVAAGYPDYGWPSLTLSNALVRAGAPPNWMTYTPWRDLAGAGPAWGRVEANSWVIRTSETGLVTLAAKDMWEQDVTISGRNGDVVTLSVTNSQIAEGFTANDYGWKHLPAIMNQFAWIDFRCAFSAVGFPDGGRLYGSTWTTGNPYTNCVSEPYAAALAGACATFDRGAYSGLVFRSTLTYSATATTYGPMSVWWCDDPLYQYRLQLVSDGPQRMVLGGTGTSNRDRYLSETNRAPTMGKDVCWYVYASTNDFGRVEANGTGATPGKWVQVATGGGPSSEKVVNGGYSYIAGPVIGTDDCPVAPDAPATNGVATAGIVIREGMALVKPHYIYRGDY